MNYQDLIKKLKDAASDKETPDAVYPTDSPIDLIAGGVAGRLGGAMAADAAPILRNEMGSIGDIVKKVPNMFAGKADATKESLEQIFRLASEGAPGMSQQQIAQAVQNRGQAIAAQDLNIAQTAARKFAALKDKLLKR